MGEKRLQQNKLSTQWETPVHQSQILSQLHGRRPWCQVSCNPLRLTPDMSWTCVTLLAGGELQTTAWGRSKHDKKQFEICFDKKWMSAGCGTRRNQDSSACSATSKHLGHNCVPRWQRVRWPRLSTVWSSFSVTYKDVCSSVNSENTL